MKEIILDESLEIQERDFPKFNHRNLLNINGDFEKTTNIDAEITHGNYLHYLVLCWKRHYGVVISPTILWNMVLNNLAFEVNKEPETYRKYFTESEGKQEIIVVQGGNLINVSLIINELPNYIPSTILDDAFPEFSTDDEDSLMADYTAFLDMVSPYYNYSMLLCGIPKIKVLGTVRDWRLFIVGLDRIAQHIPEFKEYLSVVGQRINDLLEDNCDYSNLFELKRCGSGSQVEVSGWIRDFFIEQPSVPYPENFVSCISKIDYRCYNDNKDYRMYAGLFKSKLENDYLIPSFDKIYFLNKGEAEPKSTEDNEVTLQLTTKTVETETRKL